MGAAPETSAIAKGKPGESRGRKATGLNESRMVAEPPNLRKTEGALQHQPVERPCAIRTRTHKAIRLATLIGSSIVWGACLASSHSRTCEPSLARELATKVSGRVKVIVQFEHAPGRAEWRRLSKEGVDGYRHLDLIDAVAASVPVKAMRRLLHDNLIRNISLDQEVRKSDAFTVGSSFAGVAWEQYGVSGSGVGVAVLDTGITNIADFGGYGPCRLIDSAVFSSDNNNHDDCGHGTHVAGIIAGDGLSSTGKQYSQTILGIAPRANVISVKVLDHTGSGLVSNVVQGISWCLANRSKDNIRVINMSLGHPVGQSYTTDPLCQAVESAWKAGIVVVCAAGNEGRLNVTAANGAPNGGYGTNYSSVECPGNDPYVITVGAMKSVDGIRADDQIATYSGRGPSLFDFVVKPDIVAPGNKVVSTEDPGSSYLVQTYASQVQIPATLYWPGHQGYSNAYYMLSGTSMATPVVSGAIALMLQQAPGLTPDTVKARLMISADKWADPTGAGDPCTYGAGYLDLPAAMACTAVPSVPALSPTVFQDGCGEVILEPSFVSGQRALWGSGLAGPAGIYGSRALWGSATLSSSRALWGSGFWNDNATSTITSQSLNLSSSNVVLTGE